ncbi:hypothetical protein PRIPAC_79867 [Pristionchus pacificus]|uniref:Uncharacterized protein n=1 Tax=Pristionchus pacificus TaxID=54126 RepID=A0A2A6BYQ5_PRIPA|nr:hypothetical protein PRIPAC_79867 [Pristionchus pacificus]|eukprot:PDM71074.1 hypothetical protein PRIPAC_44470 [Pristionchus pacificus]
MYQSSLVQSSSFTKKSPIPINEKRVNDSPLNSKTSKWGKKESTTTRRSPLIRPTKLSGESSDRIIPRLDALQLSANGIFEKNSTGGRTKISPIKLELMERSEIEMLKSINRSKYSSLESHGHDRISGIGLNRHEFEDLSPEEDNNGRLRQCKSAGVTLPEDSSRQGRRKGMEKGDGRGINNEREGIKIRSTSAVTTRNEMITLEDRGYRRRKITNVSSTSTQRGESSTRERSFHPPSHPPSLLPSHLQNLIYDTHFDCYYDPVNEKYYKITHM